MISKRKRREERTPEFFFHISRGEADESEEQLFFVDTSVAVEIHRLEKGDCDALIAKNTNSTCYHQFNEFSLVERLRAIKISLYSVEKGLECSNVDFGEGKC